MLDCQKYHFVYTTHNMRLADVVGEQEYADALGDNPIPEPTDLDLADPETSNDEPVTEVDEGGSTDSLKLYLNEIGQVSLLSREQEQEMFKIIERGWAARNLINNHQSIISDKRFIGLDDYVIAGHSVHRHVIEANLRLVVSIAKAFDDSRFPLGDAIQSGNIGLMRAVFKFNYRFGNKFSTYATYWIRQQVQREKTEQNRNIRLPVHVVEKLGKIDRLGSELAHKRGKKPDAVELAGYIISKNIGKELTEEDFEKDPELDKRRKKTAEEIRQLEYARNHTISSDLPIGEEQDGTLMEMVADPQPDVSEYAFLGLLKEAVARVLDDLPPRERIAIEMHYGLNGNDGVNVVLEEVGEKLGLTRERARQIEAKAFARLREDPRMVALNETFK